jgi:hypothetical protein
MGIDATQKLHWTQRVALVRHNLHAARRSNDFSFFKALQAHAVIDGTDHVAILHTLLGNDADTVLSTLDNLNAGIAYVHQDAFKAVYDGAKSSMYKADNSPSSRRSLIRVDICQQRDIADLAIDKTANSAVQLIQAQSDHCQDAVANAWITGTTIIADAVCVCLKQMDLIEDSMDDFIRLEYSWGCVQSSADAAISALRGIFSLMDRSQAANSENPRPRNLSVSSATGPEGGGGFRSRASSTASALGLFKRAFSHAQLSPPSTQKPFRTGSIAESNPRGLRASVSAACPTRLSNYSDRPHTILTTIPPTPSVHEHRQGLDASMSPFKDKGDYFAFDMEEAEAANKRASSPSPSDIMQM